jgi:hypothetical protein
LRLAPSAIHGRGVFAAEPVARGAVAFRFEGPLVPAARVSQRGIQVWRDWYVDPEAPGRFVNHACAPTCEVTRGLEVRPRRRLRAGEELTIDYSSVVLWEPWRMACACGAAACRGEVRAWGRVPAAVRARYPAPLFTFLERGVVPADLPAALATAARVHLAQRQRLR